jgi:hypothetical protein
MMRYGFDADADTEFLTVKARISIDHAAQLFNVLHILREDFEVTGGILEAISHAGMAVLAEVKPVLRAIEDKDAPERIERADAIRSQREEAELQRSREDRAGVGIDVAAQPAPGSFRYKATENATRRFGIAGAQSAGGIGSHT